MKRLLTRASIINHGRLFMRVARCLEWGLGFVATKQAFCANASDDFSRCEAAQQCRHGTFRRE